MIFIAEIGLNHNGNHDLIFEMIRLAKNAGADIAKIQLGWRSGDGEINAITPDTLTKLKDYADYCSIELAASVFTTSAYQMYKAIKPKTYKIASRTLNDQPDLVKQVIAENPQARILISNGMWRETVLPFKAPNVQYFWCKAKYPALPSDIADMPLAFGDDHQFQGFSDHTLGIEASLLAIARGATMIERHFTLDKSDRTIRDHTLSSTPGEFADLVLHGRAIHNLAFRMQK